MGLPKILIAREVDESPLGAAIFTISWKPSDGSGEEASGFVAIAHHPDSGVMTLGSCKSEKGAEGYRVACANAAQELFLSVQALTKFRLMLEGARYAQ